tara:strand:+ start:170 stop:727 length:558 start_codon:yes stop_codon:yes gene_type:complete
MGTNNNLPLLTESRVLRIIVLTTFILWTAPSFGQGQPKKEHRESNNISLNLMEGGTLASITLEHYFLTKPNYLLAFQIGVGVGLEGDFNSFSNQVVEKVYLLNVPSRLSFCVGGTNHFFETGFGGTIINGDLFGPALLYPIVGYRFQEFGDYNSCFRLFFQLPIVEPTNRSVMFVPVGISLGRNF